jgi:hypothetical protein
MVNACIIIMQDDEDRRKKPSFVSWKGTKYETPVEDKETPRLRNYTPAMPVMKKCGRNLLGCEEIQNSKLETKRQWSQFHVKRRAVSCSFRKLQKHERENTENTNLEP